MKKFTAKFKSLPQYNFDKSFKKEQQDCLNKAGVGEIISNALNTIIGVTYDVAPTITGILVISININPWYAAAYLVSTIGYLKIEQFFSEQIDILSKKEFDITNSAITAVAESRDNIIIGNKYNLTVWWQRFQRIYKADEEISIKQCLLQMKTTLFGKIFAAVPVISVTVWSFIQNSKINKLLGAIPTHIKILQQLANLHQSIMGWNIAMDKLEALNLSIEEPYAKHQEPEYSIDWGKLHFNDSAGELKFNSVEDFLQNISARKNGRITIQGDNGIGKSILMALLADCLNEKGITLFYRPCDVELSYDLPVDADEPPVAADKDIRTQAGNNTGARLKAQIEIILCQEVNFILLDEWAAHLDETNTKEISTLLDQEARTKCIVEVTPKGENATLSTKIIASTVVPAGAGTGLVAPLPLVTSSEEISAVAVTALSPQPQLVSFSEMRERRRQEQENSVVNDIPSYVPGYAHEENDEEANASLLQNLQRRTYGCVML
jgi:ABC-type iron transport system FetAB ATPase subunit